METFTEVAKIILKEAKTSKIFHSIIKPSNSRFGSRLVLRLIILWNFCEVFVSFNMLKFNEVTEETLQSIWQKSIRDRMMTNIVGIM